MDKFALSVSKMKEIANDIYTEECRINNISFDFFPLTFVEYFKGFKSREGRCFKLSDYNLYKSCSGYCSSCRTRAFICLSNIGKKKL